MVSQKLALYLFAFVSVSCITLSFIGSDTKVIGETPCVDGLNRINLDGIMCEKSEETWFGSNSKYMFLLLIPLLIATTILLSSTKNEKI